MGKLVQDFLAAIGPRRLTDEEAEQLCLLRIKEGEDDDRGFIEMLAERARARKQIAPAPLPGEKKS